MAINRALLPQQLEAGAPDLRLTGDQSHRGTYTQRRRNQMAYGGIAGLDGRMRYGLGSWFQKAKDKVVDDLIPNEIKENPVAAALTGGALLNQFGLPDWLPGVGDDVGQNWLGELLGGIPGVPDDLNLVIGDDRDLLGRLITGTAGATGHPIMTDDISNLIIGGGIGRTGMEGSPELAGQLRNLINYTTGMEGSPELASNKAGLSSLITGLTGDKGLYESLAGGVTDWAKQQVADKLGIQRATTQPQVEWKKPLAIGLGIGALDKATRKDHQLPTDPSINIPQTAQAAMADPNLRFKPPLEATQLAADGGRIGFNSGGFTPEELLLLKQHKYNPSEVATWRDKGKSLLNVLRNPNAEGGRIGYSLGRGVESLPTDQMKEIEGQMAMITDKQMQNIDRTWPALKAGGMDVQDMYNAAKVFDDTGSKGFWGVGEREPEPMTKKEFMEYMISKGYLKLPGKSIKDFDKIKDKAQGGRIGLKKGSKKKRSWMDFLYDDEGFNLPGFMLPASIAAGSILPFLKEGGRVPAQEGGLMDLGGMEKDYRQEGGFVPIGGEEKADDVPARLSKNEFVFTADAVRAAGGGDIDEGAAVMERLMDNLEAGGTVSEESQGLEGAREMFANAQQLEKRII